LTAETLDQGGAMKSHRRGRVATVYRLSLTNLRCLLRFPPLAYILLGGFLLQLELLTY
jgi:hypothetical protein